MKQWKTRNGYIVYQLLSGRSNVFLVSNGSDYIVTDTSVNRNWNSLKKRIDTLCDGKPPLGLILTHAHFDHASSAFSMKNQYHLKIMIHKNEVEFLNKGMTPLPKGTLPFSKWISNTFQGFSKLFSYQPVNADLIVDDEYDLKPMGFDIKIISTPGHTSGSMSVIIDNEVAIVGDALFGIFRKSVFPPFANDPGLMVNSWKKLLDTNCAIYLPSHGNERGRELLSKQYEKYKEIYKLS